MGQKRMFLYIFCHVDFIQYRIIRYALHYGFNHKERHMIAINYYKLAPNAVEILLEQEAYLKTAFGDSKSLNLLLWDLIKMRVSQINQCAHCIDMHSKSAISNGESIERLFALSAWQASSLFSEKEQAILKWAELITANQDIDGIELVNLQRHLDKRAICDLTFAINAINSWNRIARVFKPEI